MKRTIVFVLSLACTVSAYAQAAIKKDGVAINTITTGVPFLRINPDARVGGMGDVGIATPADAQCVYANPAKLSFIDGERDFGVALSFTPWLKSLVNDIYLTSLTGYYKIYDDKKGSPAERVRKMQTIAVAVRYFSLGNITFTNDQGQETQQFRPNEFATDLHYSRRLGKYFGLAASLRFVYSNLAGGQSVDGALIRPGIAGAGDISWYFQKKFYKSETSFPQHNFSTGMNISNIGSKITYTSNTVRDFLPANLGVGFGYSIDIDAKNNVGFYTDVNRLLVPTPDTVDGNNNNIYDFREQSSIKGMFTSFADAPGGAAEEMREFNFGVGAEYYYNKMFGVRFGYFYEPRTKGNRQFLTAGLSVKYSIFGLNFSYLIPTSIQRNPLDNTLRFSLLFDFKPGGKKAPNTEVGAPAPTEEKPTKKKVKEDSREIKEMAPDNGGN
jgi:hypothetical protein